MKKLILPATLAVFLVACSDTNDGPKAETSISINTEEAKDAAKETFQKAERELEKGAAKAKEKLDDAGDAISEKFADAKDKLTDDDKPSLKIEVNKD